MIEKLKKLGIVLTIAILFTIFIFSLTSAIYPKPEYDDFCEFSAKIAQPLDREKCGEILPEEINCRGPVEYTYGEDGCPIEASCNSCYEGYETAQEKYNLVLFLVSSIVGVMAILFGLFYDKKGAFWGLAKAGFLIGGLISLFVGTGIYYDDMARYLKPLVIFLELFIVLLVTYRVIKK
ncbi:hypothetical protein HQ529_01750 [Candidatus Woesearchaeota archaeon]|nr:hypothetical protein [Candidatus Woesearchaeota archaeon]